MSDEEWAFFAPFVEEKKPRGGARLAIIGWF
jgi:hypothetical protein